MKKIIATFAAALTLTGLSEKVELSLENLPVDEDLPIVTTKSYSEFAKEFNKQEEAGPNYTSTHSCWCAWYQTKWGSVPNDSLTPAPQEKLDEISDKYIAQCEQATKDRPADADTWMDLGDALIFRCRWQKARDAFKEVLRRVDSRSLKAAKAYYRIAETYFGEGDLESAKKTLAEVVALKIVVSGRGIIPWPSLAHEALKFLTGEDLNYYDMPVDTDFKPFPEPQQAEYTEEFAPCPEIALELKGVKESDARISLLTKKLTWRGWKWNFGGKGYPLLIALDASASVEKPEGYTLEVKREGASIKARDLRGILWGIVSFLQVADRKNHTARICKINDWPDCPRRGYLGTHWSGCTEFTVFNKMTTVVHQHHPLDEGRDSPLNVYQCERLANEFRDLGLEVQYGMVTWTMDMAWPYCWKKYLGMQIEVGKRFAAMGAGVYYPNDDCRYADNVLRQEDLADGKKPSDFDAQHILDFYNAIKKDYPNFIMTYCPPFYWGPNAGHPYPDDRNKYLESMRIFPKEISIIWTGDRVKSYHKERWMVEWVRDLTHHKPLLFQNATGPHERLSYVVDRTDWNGWHYPGFFEEDIDGYLKNATTPTECPQITTLADCLWNVKGYDKERAVRRGLSNYAGAEFFKLLDSVYGDLCYIDKYHYGNLTSMVRDENKEKIEAMYDRIEKATAAATALKGEAFMSSCAAWTRAVGWFKGLRDTVRNPPDFKRIFKSMIDQSRSMAMVMGYRPDSADVFLDPIDLHHSEADVLPKPKKHQPPPKNQKLLCGIWDDSRADAVFKVKYNGKAEGEAKVLICGNYDSVSNGPNPENRFGLKINGKFVFNGPTPFSRDFTTQTFKVPLSEFNLKGENTIWLENGRQDHRLWIAAVVILFPKEDSMDDITGESDEISLDE